MPKIPNIVIFIIVGILIILGVYLFYRTKEKINDVKSKEAGNWFTNLFN